MCRRKTAGDRLSKDKTYGRELGSYDATLDQTRRTASQSVARRGPA